MTLSKPQPSTSTAAIAMAQAMVEHAPKIPAKGTPKSLAPKVLAVHWFSRSPATIGIAKVKFLPHGALALRFPRHCGGGDHAGRFRKLYHILSDPLCHKPSHDEKIVDQPVDHRKAAAVDDHRPRQREHPDGGAEDVKFTDVD